MVTWKGRREKKKQGGNHNITPSSNSLIPLNDKTTQPRGHWEPFRTPPLPALQELWGHKQGTLPSSVDQTVTRDRALSPKSGFSTDRAPRHSEPGAQTLLVPTHFPYPASLFSTTIPSLFFTLFFAFVLFCFSPPPPPATVHA